MEPWRADRARGIYGSQGFERNQGLVKGSKGVGDLRRAAHPFSVLWYNVKFHYVCEGFHASELILLPYFFETIEIFGDAYTHPPCLGTHAGEGVRGGLRSSTSEVV